MGASFLRTTDNNKCSLEFRGGTPQKTVPFVMTFDSLPGGLVVGRGLDDIAAGVMTDEALLVMIGGPRLRRLGVTIPSSGLRDPEMQLYQRLAASGANSAHSRYNAMIRLLVSFERALQSAIL